LCKRKRVKMRVFVVGVGGGGGGVVEKKKVTRVFVAIAFFYAFLCGGVIMMKVMSPSFLCLKKK